MTIHTPNDMWDVTRFLFDHRYLFLVLPRWVVSLCIRSWVTDGRPLSDTGSNLASGLDVCVPP